MRITDRSLSRNYLNNLTRNLKLYNESAMRLQSGRRFQKMSENVSDGTRALNLRTQQYKNKQYQENVKKAGESLTMAETNLTSIEDILNSVHEQTIKALNGTNESASEIFSIDFASLKNQVVEFANCKYNDMYILGGTNNKSVPFEVDENGDLLYNGVNVNRIVNIDGEVGYFEDEEEYEAYMEFLNSEESEGSYWDNVDREESSFAKVPYSDDIFLDIGIGLSVKNGVVDPRSAFNMSVSGLDALGFGTTELTYKDVNGNEHTMTAPNNAYELLDEMSKAVAEKDFDKLGALNDHLKETINDLVVEIADVGIRGHYLENHTNRLENEEDQITEIQQQVEFIDDKEELMIQKMLEFQWLLTLQYGGKVIPQSLMDYVQM